MKLTARHAVSGRANFMIDRGEALGPLTRGRGGGPPCGHRPSHVRRGQPLSISYADAGAFCTCAPVGALSFGALPKS